MTGTIDYPTMLIDLPSRGWFYPEGHPLSNGQLEMHFMTARHEDILTSRSLVVRGVVIDKLMESLIANKAVKYDDLLLGDKNYIIVAARINGYGANYQVSVLCPQCGTSSTHDINLENIENKLVEFKEEQRGRNEFSFTLPLSKKTITFGLLTHGDEKLIEAELAGMRKTGVQITQEVTTRMRRSIKSVDGETDGSLIREFVNNMPARDAMAFREYAQQINPDIDMTFDFNCSSCGHTETKMEVPVDVNFFWPNARV